MALRHTTLPIEGVQFHPESIMTSHGKNYYRISFANIVQAWHRVNLRKW